VYPEVVASIDDAQVVLPTIVLAHTSTTLQIFFFGALNSAILRTTSGAILAPASILAENIIKPLKNNSTDAYLLRTVRVSVIIIALIATVMANMQSNIYELVAQSSALSLVSLFVPLTAGIYWKRATETGALAAMSLGMLVWLYFEFSDYAVPSLIPGLAASIIGQCGGDVWRRYH
jgi:Na+/proline symporter